MFWKDKALLKSSGESHDFPNANGLVFFGTGNACRMSAMPKIGREERGPFIVDLGRTRFNVSFLPTHPFG